MNGRTAIETASASGDLTFRVSAIDPLGADSELRITIFSPTENSEISESFRCEYLVEPINLTGEVIGTNPFHVIRLAVFQVRVKLHYRFPDWCLRYASGARMDLGYEESA